MRRKNRKLIAATHEELSSEGKQSAILETLCEKFLGFAKINIKVGKMTKNDLKDIPIGIRADQIELCEHQAGYESK